MKFRVLLAAAGMLAASAGVYGQASLAGKWQTDNVPAALAAIEAQKNAPAPEAGGRGGRGGGQAIILDLKVDASGKISGTVNEIGNDPILNIETGMITGKTITWVTQPRGVTWNLEMTDDNTVTLTGRVFAGRGGGGAAKGRLQLRTPVELPHPLATARRAAVGVVLGAAHSNRSCSIG